MASFSCVLFAQGVFVTPGKNGPVFSNLPQAGAREVQLKPLNVIEPLEVPDAAPAFETSPKASENAETGDHNAASFYTSFFVVYPENNGAVAASTAAFDIHLALDPPLQLGQQHAFVVAINGRSVAQRFTTTEFMIPPEFWNDRLPPDNQLLQLDASIVDGDGRLIKRAEPVQFLLRRLAFAPSPRPRVRRPPDSPAPIIAPTPRRGLERVPSSGDKAQAR